MVTEAVFRRRRIFLLTFCLVMGAVLLVTLLMPKRYSAEAKLMVQNVRSVDAAEDESGRTGMVSGERCEPDRGEQRGGPAGERGDGSAGAGDASATQLRRA